LTPSGFGTAQVHGVRGSKSKKHVMSTGAIVVNLERGGRKARSRASRTTRKDATVADDTIATIETERHPENSPDLSASVGGDGCSP